MGDRTIRTYQIQMGQCYDIEGSVYRLFYVSADVIGAIAMKRSEIVIFDAKMFSSDVTIGKYQLVEMNTVPFVPTVSESQRRRIAKLKPIMDDLLFETYPAWNRISKTGATLPEVGRSAEAAGMGKRNFRKLFYAYLRSGCDEMSLADGRTTKHIKGASAAAAAPMPTQEIVSKKQLALEHALRVFKEKLNAREAYDSMLEAFYSYSHEEFNEFGVLEIRVNAEKDAPSYYTVYRYISNHLGGLKISEYIRGEKENRNNHRILTGTQQSGIVAIGQHMQVDEWEAPVDLIDDDCNIIGKPIVYCAFESRAQIIIGLYIGLTNNSREGLTNLFISMLEPHIEQTKPYGIECTDYNFPSCVIPRRVSSDQGSEYMANNMEQIMYALHLVQSPAPAGSGSYKGGVENVFKRLQTRIKRLLINDGYIMDTHDGPQKARDKACLNIEQFRQICYRLVLELNTSLLGNNYIPDRELINSGIPSVPSRIWQYEREMCFDPQMVTDENRSKILFALLWIDRNFSLDRAGFHYKQLRYIVDEPWLRKLMSAHNPKYEVRYNPIDVSRIYVRCDNVMYCVPLSESIDQYRSYVGLSWETYDELQKAANETRRTQKKADLDTSLTTRARNEQTLAQAKAAHVGTNSKEEIREARAAERARIQIDPNEPRARLLEQEFPSPSPGDSPDITADIPRHSSDSTNTYLAALLVDPENDS